MFDIEGERRSTQTVDRAAREHRDVFGNEALSQGRGAIVLQEVQTA